MDIFIAVIIVAVIGLIAGLGLAFASKFMAVPTDERQQKIRDALPGANCGACGYSGCDGYAAAVASGEAEPNKCAPGGAASAAALSEILGVEAVNEPKVAFIACKGNPGLSKRKYLYEGAQKCVAANMLGGGPLECEFGCIGFGDCAAVCPFGAITVIDGKPQVCKDICVGCGKCVKACPKSLIRLVGKDAKTLASCSNKQKGASVVKACSVSCIACKMCEKVCEKGAVKVIDNVAVVDNSLCSGCGKCITACKRGVLTKF